MKEEWRLIDGMKYHEVSNTGKVRSIGNVVVTKNGTVKKMKPKELKGGNNGVGYLKVCIKEDGVERNEYIHRLVAKAFIPNPLNKPCVNHLDNNPANNNENNLEWVTKAENTNWMIVQGRFRRTEQWINRLNKSLDKYRVPVVGTNIKTGEQIFFKSVNSVKEKGFLPSMVSRCINGKRNEHHGYTWERLTSREAINENAKRENLRSHQTVRQDHIVRSVCEVSHHKAVSKDIRPET